MATDRSLRRLIPNAMTVARLILAAIFFALIAWYSPAQPNALLLNFAAALFVIAAATDFLDGLLARRWGVTSAFGRVMDPFCDKILVLGALIFLAGPSFLVSSMSDAEVIPQSDLAGIAIESAPPGETSSADEDAVVPAEIPSAGELLPVRSLSGIFPWMVVVILARELLVTSIRGVAESSGIAFGAVRAGKLKMVLQSVTVPAVLVIAANFDPLETGWSRWLRDVLVYAMVLATVLSGIPYITQGVAAFQTDSTAKRDSDSTSPRNESAANT